MIVEALKIIENKSKKEVIFRVGEEEICERITRRSMYEEGEIHQEMWNARCNLHRRQNQNINIFLQKMLTNSSN